MALDGDPRRSASHDNLIGHLAGPFLAGTTQTPLPLTPVADGLRGVVDWVSRERQATRTARRQSGALEPA